MGRRRQALDRVAELEQIIEALELRAGRAEAEAEASSRAAQGSDQRAQEARADRAEMQAALARAQEREAVVWPARIQRWQARLIEAEDRLRGLRGGGAGHWKNRAENATARYESALKRIDRLRGALGALEEAHRRLKRADHSKSVQIGRLTAEVEAAGLRGPEPELPLGAGASLPGKPERFRVPSEITVRVGQMSGLYRIVGFRQDSEQGLTELDLETLGPPRHGVT